MKTTNQLYYALNSSLMQSPRYVVEIAYDFASTDLVYFTSHSDCQYPSGATVIENVIADNGLSGTSQKLDPLEATATIGTMTINLIDYNNAITTQIGTKLASGFGLKGKRVRVYRGFEGLDWADYELFQTQIVDTVSIDNGVYTIRCADVQRSQRKNIFEIKETTLTASIGLTDTLIPCADYSAFVRVYHGSSYSDAPNSTVGYIRIDDEVIRYSGFTVDGIKGPCFVVDTAHSRGRGALGTAPAEHDVDSTASSDRRKTIEEFVYLELPLVKLAYAILTGTLYGDAASLPDHWHLNISTAYVSTAEFVFIGTDWWDISDDTKGRIGRFAGLTKEDGKKFLETEIYQLLGAYSPVLSDGQLGLRRLTRVLFDASPVATIGKNEIISNTELTHDMRDVENQIQIAWNWDFLDESYTRTNLIIDSGSISTHGPSPVRELQFKGLHGSRHTLNTLYEHFGTLRDRYAGPPQKIRVTLLGRNHLKEVGDIVQLKHPDIYDFVTGTSINRTFEVQQVSIDWSTGRVTLDLFGSSQAAGLDALSSADVLLDTYYTSAGTNIETFPGVTNISGVIHVTSNLDITGSIGTTDATAAGSIIYSNGPLQIDSSVTLTCKLNTQIRVKGHFQVDGTITTKGRGFAGATAAAVPSVKNTYDLRWYVFTNPPDPGVPTLGVTASQGGVVTGDSNAVYHGKVYSGTIKTLPYYILSNNNGTGILGLPKYLVGVAGPSGGHSAINGGSSSDRYVKGGDGGNSGGGLLIISRGFDVGAGGQINVSGNDGGQGTYDGYSASGAGAGGHPGGVVILLDGNSTYPTGLSRISCWRGVSPYLGTPIFPNQSTDHPGKIVSSAYEESALEYFDASSSMVRVQYIPDYKTAEADVKTYADVPTAINITELVNTPQTPASNLASLEISVTPPTDSVYLYSDIYYKLPTQDAWIYVGPADSETVAVVPMDGTTYDIKAVPVSITGAVSTNYITDQVTVSNQAGGVYLGTNNYIAYGKTSFLDDINNGFWLGVNALNYAQFNIGDITDSLKWDGTNLSITGNINAESGTIGGWGITASALTSPDTRITLDAANNWINAENVAGTNYVVLDGDGFRAYDVTLGQTVNIPTNGAAPEFSSGTIKEYTYEMYTSGIIKTDADPATNGGVLINNSGLSVYNGSGVRTAYLDGINSNHELTGTITVTGGDFPLNDNLIFDPGFNEKVVRGIDYWQTHARATYAASVGENNTAGVTLFPNSTQIVVYGQQFIKAKAGETYFVSARVYETTGTDGSYGIGLDAYDADQVFIAASSDTVEITAGTNQSVWKDFSGSITIPAVTGVAYVRFYMIVQATSTTGSLKYDNIRISKVEDGATVGATSANLTAGPGINMLLNPGWQGGNADGWTRSGTGTGWTVGFNATNWCISDGGAPQGTLYIISGAPDGFYVDYFATSVPVIPGNKMELSVYVGAHRCTVQAFVKWSDSTGATISYGSTNQAVNDLAGGTSLSLYTRLSGLFTVPANAAVGSVFIRKSETAAGQINSMLLACLPYFGVAYDGQTELSAWNEGTNTSEPGATNTTRDITNGLTITAGYITYGTNTTRIDFANRRITIGNESYGGDGIQLEYNAGNPRAYIGNGSTNYVNFDGTTLSVKGIFSSTGASGAKRIEINPGNDNELHFYGDIGNGTIEEISTIGLSSVSSDTVVGKFGSLSAGSSRVGIYAASNSRPALIAASLYASDGAISASNANGYAIRTTTSGTSPLQIFPSASSAAPTHSAYLGSLWVTSLGILYINTSGSNTWQKVGAQ